MNAKKKLAIGADHAGFKLKTVLLEELKERGYDVRDVGTDTERSVDYPDYAAKVARLVSHGDVDQGILLCGSGLGVAIAANKVDGVRAITANEPELARLGRLHNDANVLALGARLLSADQARDIVNAWLASDFEGGRHQRRVAKITDLEKGRSR